MSIICPACGISLNQITNTHIRSKHPEFNSLPEFRDHYQLETTWSSSVKEKSIKSRTGLTRGSYDWSSGKHADAMKLRDTAGESHWNYGNITPDSVKENISASVKNSQKFIDGLNRWLKDDRREEVIRLASINNLKTRAALNQITSFEERSKWQQYQILVAKFTRISLRKYRSLIDPSSLLKLREYDLDHMFSKFEGFKQGISPEIIGSVVNLTPLHYIANREKRIRCSITLDDLLEKYTNFTTSLPK